MSPKREVKKLGETLTVRRFQRFKLGKQTMQKLVLPAFQKIDAGRVQERMKNCGEFINVATCTNCEKEHFQGFNRCKVRWCIPCNAVKVKIWISKLCEPLKNWTNSGNKIALLTLTMKDQPMGKLDNMLNVLQIAWRIFQNGKGNRKRFNKRFIGGVKSLEVKVGKGSGMWHAHYHLLVMYEAGRYQKDFDWLCEEWNKSVCMALKSNLSEKQGSVHIKQLKGDKSFLKGIIEGVKYIMKPETEIYKPERLQEAYNALYGRRAQSTFGKLYGISKEVEKENNIDEKKLDRFICQACGCTEAVLHTELYKEINKNLLDIDYSRMY